jgi:GntR family transcriptional repressor for pyruvate dehydrogenase complex
MTDPLSISIDGVDPTESGPASSWDGPIITQSVADHVADRLVTAIALGVYVPAQQLPSERELAAMLGVSRTSVRDALSRLTSDGYLEVRRGRYGGYFVLSDWGPSSAEQVRRHLVPKWSEFEHLFDARSLIEPMIARTAAARRSAEDSADIAAAVQAYSDAADHDQSRSADGDLHFAIARSTHNPLLIRLSVDLRTRISLNLGAEPYSDDVRRKAIEQHRDLAAAVIDGRADDAARIAANHFTLSENLIRDLVRRTQDEESTS